MTTIAATTSGLKRAQILGLVGGLILIAFVAFSVWVAVNHGPLGFLSLAGREPWALQMLLDLALALSFGLGWVRADAKRHGIAAWPYFIATISMGSIGLLAYVVRRGFSTTPR
jgi:hypothetical protein